MNDDDRPTLPRAARTPDENDENERPTLPQLPVRAPVRAPRRPAIRPLAGALVLDSPAEAFFASASAVANDLDVEADDPAAWLAEMRRRSFGPYVAVLVALCGVVCVLSFAR